MKKHIKKISRFGFIKSWMVASSLIMIVAATVGLYGMNGVSAAAATLSLSPASGSYTTGQTITVAINENSASEAVNGVNASLTYPTSTLQFVSINGNSSGFGVDAGSTGGSGVVNISRGAIAGITGSQLVADVSFNVISTGSAAINFQPSCVGNNGTNCSAVLDATSYVNIISGTTGANFTLQAPAVPVTPVTPVTPPKTATTSYASSSQTKASSTAITPSGSSTSVTVPNGSSVQVNQPVTVGPATIQDQGVSEIQYYLNNKLVHTSMSPPYTYTVSTNKLLNGTYTLKTKTLYSSGTSSTTTQTLHVNNPLSFTQAWLFFKKYLLLPLILIVVVLVAYLLFRKFNKHHNPFGTPTGYNGGGGDGSEKAYIPQPTAPVIRPTIVTG